MERKYRQKGYMDAYGREKREKREAPPKRGESIGPRPWARSEGEP